MTNQPTTEAGTPERTPRAAATPPAPDNRTARELPPTLVSPAPTAWMLVSELLAQMTAEQVEALARMCQDRLRQLRQSSL
jgi:hypothetical protein